LEPEGCGGEVGEAQEVELAPVISRGEAPEVLELVEAALDAIAVLVERGVVRDAALRVGFDGMTASRPMAAMVARRALLS
jgi:hypothetical protein